MAFRRGDQTEEAMVGALLRAEEMAHQRVVANFAIGVSKSGARRRRTR